jgi:hypothetical protein
MVLLSPGGNLMVYRGSTHRNRKVRFFYPAGETWCLKGEDPSLQNECLS